MNLSSQQIDYSALFPDAVGELHGVYLFIVEQFVVRLLSRSEELEEGIYHPLNLANCYLVLCIQNEEFDAVAQTVYQWVGPRASIDKRACSAMQAVNLKALLSMRATIRYEEYENESVDFARLFEEGLTYEDNDDEATPRILSPLTERILSAKLYQFIPSKAILAAPPLLVAPYRSSIEQSHSFVLDTGQEIMVWHGRDTCFYTQCQCMAYAEIMNVYTLHCQVTCIASGSDGDDDAQRFWDYLMDDESDEDSNETYLCETVVPYRIDESLVAAQEDLTFKDFVQSQQINESMLLPSKSLLTSDACFLLDCGVEIYVWFGKQSSLYLREAAVEAFRSVYMHHSRPPWFSIVRIYENHERESFKLRFSDWFRVPSIPSLTNRIDRESGTTLSFDDIDLKLLYASITPKSVSYFLSASNTLSFDRLVTSLNDALVSCNVYHYAHGVCKSIKRVEPLISQSNEQFLNNGTFPTDPTTSPRLTLQPYSDSSYVIVCVYNNNDHHITVVYFWQGQQALRTDYPSFLMSTWPELRLAIDDVRPPRPTGSTIKLIRVRQGREPLALAALWNRQIVVHCPLSNCSVTPTTYDLKRSSSTTTMTDITTRLLQTPRMYHIRLDAYRTCRTVEIACNSKHLISRDAFLIVTCALSTHTRHRNDDNTSEETTEKDNNTSSREIQQYVYVWYGKGISKTLEMLVIDRAVNQFVEAMATATTEHGVSLTETSPIVKTIYESSEPRDFWSIFPPEPFTSRDNPIDDTDVPNRVDELDRRSSLPIYPALFSLPKSSLSSSTYTLLSQRTTFTGKKQSYGKSTEYYYLPTPILLRCSAEKGCVQVTPIIDTQLMYLQRLCKKCQTIESNLVRSTSSIDQGLSSTGHYSLPRLFKSTSQRSNLNLSVNRDTDKPDAEFFTEAVLSEIPSAFTTRLNMRRQQSDHYQQLLHQINEQGQPESQHAHHNKSTVEYALPLRCPPFLLTQADLLASTIDSDFCALYSRDESKSIDQSLAHLSISSSPVSELLETVLISQYSTVMRSNQSKSIVQTSELGFVDCDGIRSCVILDSGYPEPLYIWVGRDASDVVKRRVHQLSCELILWRQKQFEVERSLLRTGCSDISPRQISSQTGSLLIDLSSSRRTSSSLGSLVKVKAESEQVLCQESSIETLMESEVFTSLYQFPGSTINTPITVPTGNEKQSSQDDCTSRRRKSGQKRQDPVSQHIRVELQGQESMQFRSFFHAWTAWDRLKL